MTSTHASTPAPASPQVGKPLLLFFYSPVEGRSRRVEGYLAQVLQRRRNHGTFQLTRIDAGTRPDLVERFRIESLPSLLVVDEQRVRARLTQPRGTEEITELLAPWLH